MDTQRRKQLSDKNKSELINKNESTLTPDLCVRYQQGRAPPAPARSFRKMWEVRCSTYWKQCLVLFAFGQTPHSKFEFHFGFECEVWVWTFNAHPWHISARTPHHAVGQKLKLTSSAYVKSDLSLAMKPSLRALRVFQLAAAKGRSIGVCKISTHDFVTCALNLPHRLFLCCFVTVHRQRHTWFNRYRWEKSAWPSSNPWAEFKPWQVTLTLSSQYCILGKISSQEYSHIADLNVFFTIMHQCRHTSLSGEYGDIWLDKVHHVQASSHYNDSHYGTWLGSSDYNFYASCHPSC